MTTTPTTPTSTTTTIPREEFLLITDKFTIRHGFANLNTMRTHNLVRPPKREEDGGVVTVDDLRNAAHRLVESNPILSGVLSLDKNGHLVATSGMYMDYVKVVEDGSIGDIPPVPLNEADGKAGLDVARYLTEIITPLAPALPNSDVQIRDGLNVFQVYIVPLPGGFIYYSFQVSHTIGDGNTYYMLLEQFNILAERRSIVEKPIIWRNESTDFFAKEKLWIKPRRLLLFLLLMIVGRILDFFRPPPVTESHVMLLSRDKIAEEKERLTDPRSKEKGVYLSANDVVVMAVCQAIVHTFPVLCQTVNFRPRRSYYKSNDAGLLSHSIILDAERCSSDPYLIREISRDLTKAPYGFFVGQKYPFFKVARTAGRMSNISNTVSLSRSMEWMRGMICHMLYEDMFTGDVSPGGLATVFQWNADTMAIMHNYREGEFKGREGMMERITL